MMILDELSRRLRVLADPFRLRLLALLRAEELAVTELSKILNSGQPRVSGQLSKLAEEGLVTGRRRGRSTLYRARPGLLDAEPILVSTLDGFAETEEARLDAEACQAILAERPDETTPGTLGRDYLPGRTWEGLARALLSLLPKRRIADLGIGRGELTLLWAEAAERVIAVDADPDVLRGARERARTRGIEGVEFRHGDLEDPPVEAGEVDLWVLSQVLHLCASPAAALTAARDRLEAGGQVLVLDLLQHRETWVEDRLGHRRLGFGETELASLLEDAGFVDVSVSRVARDRKPPHFITLLATGRKPR